MVGKELSPTNVAEMALFYIKLTIHNDFHLEEEPVSRTGRFNQSLDSLYDTDSPSCVSNIALMPIFLYKTDQSLTIFL